MITNIDITGRNSLDFEVKIEGVTTGKPVTARFFISEQNIEYSFLGEKHGDSYKFSIPPLKSVLNPGVYDCHLDIVVEDTHFSAITDKIELSLPVQIKEARMVDKEKVKPKIKVTSVSINETLIVPEKPQTKAEKLREERLLAGLERMMQKKKV